MGFAIAQAPLYYKEDNTMLKKTITYVDYNGTERSEDFYFNLSKAEVTEMELSVKGGLSEMIEKIVKTQDIPKIFATFKELILKSYGEKSADGRRFMKSEEICKNFYETEAYSALLEELSSDADKASDFIKGILPSAPADKPAVSNLNVVSNDDRGANA